jgi:hypothetical protein
MERWEYLTRFVRADAKSENAKAFLKQYNPKQKTPPAYTPESMMPELDALGDQGWELVHMEPVARVGKKGDVLFTGGSEWSNTYFCVFKRRKPVG